MIDSKLTPQDVQFSTLLFFVLGLIVSIPLVFIVDDAAFRFAVFPIGLSSAFFWFVVTGLAITFFWDIYYCYFFPTWIRWVIILDIFLYAGLGLAMLWLASQLPGPAVLIFIILGGIEGVFEHLFGIYYLRILEKVPWLEGLNLTQVVVFSFFEYIFYWALVAWLAAILIWIGIF